MFPEALSQGPKSLWGLSRAPGYGPQAGRSGEGSALSGVEPERLGILGTPEGSAQSVGPLEEGGGGNWKRA